MDNITVVPLPDDATDMSHSKQLGDDECISYWCKENLEPSVISLPPGQYDYLFTWPKCTEEECENVMNIIGESFLDEDVFPVFHATVAFVSWLRSQGHNPESKFAILKKKV